MQATKLKDATLTELQGVLRKCMIMVGIRAANIPNAEETAVLLKFIYTKFSLITIAEIDLAFEKAVAGELETEANCYENFSCEYFGRIMTAYKKWASQKFNENQMHIVPQKEIEYKEANWKELCQTYYQDYLQGKLNFDLMPWPLYDEFHRAGMMSADAYEDYLPDARQYLLTKFINYREMSESANERFDWEQKIESLNNGHEEERIIEISKKMSVKLLYQLAKKKNIKSIL